MALYIESTNHIHIDKLMIQEVQSIEQAYFKEYLCFQFKFGQQPQYKQTGDNHIDKHVNFKETANSDPQTLPTAMLDKLIGKEALYVLDWRRAGDAWDLRVRELTDLRWKVIRMNHLPQIVVISGGSLYMQAGEQLTIISIYTAYQDFRRLPEGKLIALNPCVLQYTSGEFEAGVSAVLFHESTGYKVRQYSIHHVEPQQQQRIPQLFNFIFSKKYVQFAHLEVIIPNIMALAFISSSQFCLFNLQKGEIENRTKSKLLLGRVRAGERAVVRWREHVQIQKYDKTLIMTIAVGTSIQLFFLNLKYQHDFVQELKGKELQDIHNGDFIQWQQTNFAPYLTLNTPGTVLDVAISKKGVIYYSKQDMNSQIGYCNYLNLNSIFLQSPVLTQEATVWRTYYQDKQFSELTDGNRFFIPNRYPSEMVLSLHNHQSEQLTSKLLDTWRNNYKFRNIIIYNEEILIARKGSLSVFRMLPQELYKFQYFSQDSLNYLQQIQCSNAKQNNEIVKVFAKVDSEFDKAIFLGEMDRPMMKERRYAIVNEDYWQQDEGERHCDDLFQKLTQQLQKVMTEKAQNAYSTISIPQFQLPLALSQLYDQLTHYHLAANSKSFRIELQSQRNSTKDFQMQACMVKVINYFHSLLQRAQQHYLNFGQNLIALFLQRYHHKLTADIDTSIFTFLRLLMQNLFPKRVINYLNSQINAEDIFDSKLYSNSFIQFLVQEFIQADKDVRAGDQNAEKRCKIIRDQLANIIEIGFLGNGTIFFAKFWKNTSIFKALLLSNSEKLNVYFCQYLLKKETTSFLNIYIQIRDYMLPSDVQTIQNLLFYNHHFHSVPVDFQSLVISQIKARDQYHYRHQQVIVDLKRHIFEENGLCNHSDEDEGSYSP